MACAFPVSVSFKGQAYKVPCRRCMNCRLEKRSVLETLCTAHLYESVYKKKQSACFVTLTYAPKYLPPSMSPSPTSSRNIYLFARHCAPRLLLQEQSRYHAPYEWSMANIKPYATVPNGHAYGSLVRKDFVDFMKRWRRRVDYHSTHDTPLHDVCSRIPKNIKYVYCGEYGDGSRAKHGRGSTHRPHYHAIIFGVNADDFRAVTKTCWKKGIIDVGPLQNGGVRYVLAYVDQIVNKDKGRQLYYQCGCEPPFIYHSCGIGVEYIRNHLHEIIRDGGFIKKKDALVPVPRHWLRNLGLRRTPSPEKYRQDWYNAQKAGYVHHVPGTSVYKDFAEVDAYNVAMAYVREYNAVNAFRKHGGSIDNSTVTSWSRERVRRSCGSSLANLALEVYYNEV